MEAFQNNYLQEARNWRNKNDHLKAQLAYKKAIKEFKAAMYNAENSKIKEIRDILAKVYTEYGDVLKDANQFTEAEKRYDKAKKWGSNQLLTSKTTKNALILNSTVAMAVSAVPEDMISKFFKKNSVVPSLKNDLLLTDIGNPRDTKQLVYALQQRNITPEQQKRLRNLAQDIIEEFANHQTKSSEIVREVVELACLPDGNEEKEIYRTLLDQIIEAIRKANLLHLPLLKGLSHVIRHANPSHLEHDDLVRILKILNEQLKNIHPQEKNDQQLEMIKILAQLLDAMADCEVKGLDREELHKPLYDGLKRFSKDSSNPELSYQASYACQALLCIPNNESPWKALVRRGTSNLNGVVKITSAVKNIDPKLLPEIINAFNEGFEGIKDVTLNLIEDLTSSTNQLQEGFNILQQGFDINYGRRKQWYWALRYTDLLIQSHKWISFEQFVFNVPCYQNEKFLWGLCEQLRQIETSPDIDADVHEGAHEFLKYIHQNETHYSKLFWWNTTPKLPKDLQSRLDKLKTQYLNDIDKTDEFKEALELYVKPQAKWTDADTSSFDLETEVNKFLNSTWKDILTLEDKKYLEVAAENLLASKKMKDLEEVISNILDSQDKLTSQDKTELNIAANIFVTLRSEEALKLVINRGLFSKVGILENTLKEADEDLEMVINELSKFKKALNKGINYDALVTAINNIQIPTEDKKTLETEIKQQLESRNQKIGSEINELFELDPNILEMIANKLLTFRSAEVLETTVNRFLASKNKKVLLLLGIGGTGKSTFSRYLTRRLREEYDKEQSPIPLFITLASQEKHINKNKDFIKIYLKKEANLTKNQIENLRERKFVFILNGYDEIVDDVRQCYNSNKFYKWKKSKIIINCRPEYSTPHYEHLFWPKNKEQGFQKLFITPFTQSEIQQYIENYVINAQKKYKKLQWKANHYSQQLNELPQQIKELMSNPILLKIILNELLNLVKQNKIKIFEGSCGILYENISKKWFERAQDRLTKIQLTPKELDAFKELKDKCFIEQCLEFSQTLAVAMYKDDNKIVINENVISNWARFLSDDDAKYRLLFFNSLLIRSKNQYKFLHKSLRDYLIARALWSSCNSMNPEESLFNQLSIEHEPNVQQFLVEHVQQIQVFKTQLQKFFEYSKEGMNVQVAFTNANIILNKAQVKMSEFYVSEINLDKENLNETKASQHAII
ncbi:NACHT domain-containing protein [Gigaspora margarita]|uniref:NACHT domain-containing protein n=1 Tax=Gigaspora margarita TaxID=4874 RepID=A0A8H4ARP3_GIGMA|nr:NACHT domain-containing protein [Gigaspora margarita]